MTSAGVSLGAVAASGAYGAINPTPPDTLLFDAGDAAALTLGDDGASVARWRGADPETVGGRTVDWELRSNAAAYRAAPRPGVRTASTTAVLRTPWRVALYDTSGYACFTTRGPPSVYAGWALNAEVRAPLLRLTGGAARTVLLEVIWTYGNLNNTGDASSNPVRVRMTVGGAQTSELTAPAAEGSGANLYTVGWRIAGASARLVLFGEQDNAATRVYRPTDFLTNANATGSTNSVVNGTTAELGTLEVSTGGLFDLHELRIDRAAATASTLQSVLDACSTQDARHQQLLSGAWRIQVHQPASTASPQPDVVNLNGIFAYRGSTVCSAAADTLVGGIVHPPYGWQYDWGALVDDPTNPTFCHTYAVSGYPQYAEIWVPPARPGPGVAPAPGRTRPRHPRLRSQPRRGGRGPAPRRQNRPHPQARRPDREPQDRHDDRQQRPGTERRTDPRGASPPPRSSAAGRASGGFFDLTVPMTFDASVDSTIRFAAGSTTSVAAWADVDEPAYVALNATAGVSRVVAAGDGRPGLRLDGRAPASVLSLPLTAAPNASADLTVYVVWTTPDSAAACTLLQTGVEHSFTFTLGFDGTHEYAEIAGGTLAANVTGTRTLAPNARYVTVVLSTLVTLRLYNGAGATAYTESTRNIAALSAAPAASNQPWKVGVAGDAAFTVHEIDVTTYVDDATIVERRKALADKWGAA